MSDAPKENTESTPPQDTILIAEDSPPNRKILGHLLQKLGFNVVAVISDIMMPNMDGIQLLRHVREHDKWKAIPFVRVTAVSDKEYIVQAKELDVSDYVLKPVTFQRVATKLQELFPDRKFPKLAA